MFLSSSVLNGDIIGQRGIFWTIGEHLYFVYYRAAGTLYMVQKLLYYTINLGGENTVENGQKTVEN